MVSVTRFLVGCAAGAISLAVRVQADATIFLPVPTDPVTLHTQVSVLGASPIATISSNGATEYVLTELITAVAFGTTTVTFAPTVTSFATIEEGASTYHASFGQTVTIDGQALAVDQDLSCGPTSGGDDWTCIDEFIDSMQGAGPTTFTITTVARPSAAFTVTEPTNSSAD
ncbi:hypothetical protein BDN70DRAFT_881441 [Pholiota conissans]|uniref:Uncharacterized protein n=1 Tax=Pholiota conissans TaxID=109636 RepID=A0A9P5YWY7_9AGAR|nr:hypothetical protein BDN70DRAFT_881441 [Pholiota conissans]